MMRLRDAARRRHVSIAAVVRDAVDEHLSRDPDDRERRWQRAVDAIGAFSDTLPKPFGPVAENHDAYLDEAYDWSRRGGDEADARDGDARDGDPDRP